MRRSGRLGWMALAAFASLASCKSAARQREETLRRVQAQLEEEARRVQEEQARLAPQSADAGVESAPPAPAGPLKLVDVSVGERHACGRTAEGDVYCWGSAASYQLGDPGLTTESERPRRVPDVPRAVSLSANHDRTCVVTGDGAVWCWGTEELGGFGLGKTTTWKRPTRIDGIDGAKEVALGMAHTLVLMRDGTVRGWGLNAGGTLGELPMFDLVRTPLPIPGLAKVRRVATSGLDACAVADDGSVRCWGKDPFGPKGPVGVTRPTPVAGVSKAQDVGVGSGFGCALLADHTVRCWGDNEYGQLGVGNRQKMDGSVRTHVSDVATLRVHGSSACAINTGGALLCWGANGVGQLGAAVGPQDTPFQFTELRDVVAVDVDGRGCASTGAPALFCWDDRHRGPTPVPW